MTKYIIEEYYDRLKKQLNHIPGVHLDLMPKKPEECQTSNQTIQPASKTFIISAGPKRKRRAKRRRVEEEMPANGGEPRPESQAAAPPPEEPGVARDSRGRQSEESQQRSTAGGGQCGVPNDRPMADSGADDSTGPIHAPAAEPPFPDILSRESPTDGIGSENFSPLSTATNNSHPEVPVQDTTDHPHPGTIASGEQSNPSRDGAEDPSATYVDCQNMEESAPEIPVSGACGSTGNPPVFPMPQFDRSGVFDMEDIRGNFQNMEGQESAPAIAVHGACGSTGNPSLFPPQPMEGAGVHRWFDRSAEDDHFVFDLEMQM